jgi:hypothetical protein
MITYKQYEEFVRTLIKPSEQLDVEITYDEQLLLEFAKSVLSGATQSASYLECSRPDYLNLLHMGVGLTSECGELVDAIKKIVIYRKPVGSLSEKNSIAWNVREEIGDLLWFQTGNIIIRRTLGYNTNTKEFYLQLEDFLDYWNYMYPDNIITIQSAKEFNMEKLKERYSKLTFSNEDAQQRKDKGE